MTVQSNDRTKTYTGNGVTKVFTGPLAHLSSQIFVYVNGALQVSGYTLTGVGGVTATTITFTTAPSNGAAVVIKRTVVFEQQLDITNQGTVYPEQYERAFDALTFQTQQVLDGLSSAMTLPDGSSASAQLPMPSALKALRWNSAANAIENFTPPAGTVTSVGASGSTGLSVGNSPITGSGTLTFTLSANLQSWSGVPPSSKADASSLGSAAYLNVGTTVGTVAAGDDSRLSDSREWTAATVTQAEAEAGTDTTRKAWSVLRVWQAIAAWWAGSSAKAKLDGIAAGATVGADWNANVSNKPTLGTAAAKNVPASGDAAAGEVVLGNDSRLGGSGGGVSDGDKGDVTVSGSGTTWTIDAGAVSLSKMANMATASVIYRKTAGTGAPEVQTLATLKSDLAVSASDVGLGSVTNDAQTKAAIMPNTAPAAGSIPVGNAGGTAYAPVAVSGDATLSSAGALTIDNNKISYAKMQDVSAASKLLGRGDSGSGDPQEITVGSGLTMTGTTLSASGGGGSPGGSDKQLQFNNAGAFAGASTAYWDETNKRLSIGAGTSPAATMHAKAASATNVVGIFQGTASQTGDLSQWRDNSGTVLGRVTAAGIFSVGEAYTGVGLWVGGASSHGSLNLRGDPAVLGQYGLGYNSSLDATFVYGYTGRKFALGMRDFDGTYRPRFTFDDASGVKTWTHDEGINYVFGTTTGTKLGTAASQKLGFWGATAVVQPASASQAAITDTAGGTYTSAEQTMLTNIKALVNQLRADLVTVGIIKGSA